MNFVTSELSPPGAEPYLISDTMLAEVFRRVSQMKECSYEQVQEELINTLLDQQSDVEIDDTESVSSHYLKSRVEVARSRIYDSIHKQTQALSAATVK